MNRILLLTLLIFSSVNALAYTLYGNAQTEFVLTCEDGTTNTSSTPPTHTIAVAFCEDHGGIAAGYPKKMGAEMQIKSGRTSAATRDQQHRSLAKPR